MPDSGRRGGASGYCLAEEGFEEVLFVKGLELGALLFARGPPAFILEAHLSAEAEEKHGRPPALWRGPRRARIPRRARRLRGPQQAGGGHPVAGVEIRCPVPLYRGSFVQ